MYKRQLLALFGDQLQRENELFLNNQQMGGYDEATRISLQDQDPSWIVERTSRDVNNYLRLDLNQAYGYTINIGQGDEVVYDYMLGAGNNKINIDQRQ